MSSQLVKGRRTKGHKVKLVLYEYSQSSYFQPTQQNESETPNWILHNVILRGNKLQENALHIDRHPFPVNCTRRPISTSQRREHVHQP